LIVPKLTTDVIIRSFAWHDQLSAQPNSIKDNGYLLFELFCTTDSLTSRSGSAWPRPAGFKHLVLLGAGAHPSASDAENEVAAKLVADGMEFIFGKGVKIDVVPNAVEEFHDVPGVGLVLQVFLIMRTNADVLQLQIYKEHYPKLQELKRKYDPENKLKGLISI
jgi:hypothetical protein